MIDCNPKLKLRKCNVNNSNCGRDWINLPSGVLGDISSRLTIEDYNTFANVCTSWRSARGPLSAQAPFLLLPDKDSHGKLSGSCRLLNLPDNVSYNVQLRPLRGKSLVGCQDGWLILLDNKVGVISLYNPLSQQEVKLPSHAAFIIRLYSFQHEPIPKYDQLAERYTFKKVILSKVPKSPTEPHPAAFALLRIQDFGILIYLGAGENSWNSVHVPAPGFQDIYCHRDQILGVTGFADIYKLNTDASLCTPEFMGRLGPLNSNVFSYKVSKYIAELDGSVLQIWRLFDYDKNGTETVRVLKLDMERHTWSTINDLQGHSLFLGTSNMASLSSHQIPGLKDNLIYFTGDRWVEDNSSERRRRRHLTRANLDFGAYNMKTDAFEVCPLIDGPLPPDISSTWFSPTPSEL